MKCADITTCLRVESSVLCLLHTYNLEAKALRDLYLNFLVGRGVRGGG